MRGEHTHYCETEGTLVQCTSQECNLPFAVIKCMYCQQQEIDAMNFALQEEPMEYY